MPGLAWAYLFAARPAARTSGWAKAAGLTGQALALFGQARNLYGQRSALVVLAECHAHLGNYDLARGCAQQALDLGPAAGDSPNVAFAWSVLGLAWSRLGEHHQAISCYRQALDLAREWKTPPARRWLIRLLTGFGDACQAAGDLPAARRAWEEALRIRDDLHLGSPREPWRP